MALFNTHSLKTGKSLVLGEEIFDVNIVFLYLNEMCSPPGDKITTGDLTLQGYHFYPCQREHGGGAGSACGSKWTLFNSTHIDSITTIHLLNTPLHTFRFTDEIKSINRTQGLNITRFVS